MPTYEYRCHTCDGHFDAYQQITAAPLTRCALCGGSDVERLISAGGGLIFKGSGFYATDYRSSNYKSGAKKERPGSSKPASPDTKTSTPISKTPSSSSD